MASSDSVPPAPEAAGSSSDDAPAAAAITANAGQSPEGTTTESGQASTEPVNTVDDTATTTTTTTAPGEQQLETTPQEQDAAPAASAQATGSAGDAAVPAPPAPATTATSATSTQEPTATATARDVSGVVAAVAGNETSHQPQTQSQSQSQQAEAAAAKEDNGPELVITLLLTTGARHPFKIDGKYLKGRSVSVENDDPFNMSVYTLKELIWREWRSEWEPRPSSPSYIRLISFGKLLDDKSPLSESSLTHDAPNVIHMTVKPQEVADEDDAKGGKSYSGRGREASERSPGCRCIIL